MTDAVRFKTGELKHLILSSEEYHKYDMCRRKLNEMPELKKKVNEFRNANMQIRLSGSSQDAGRTQQIGMEYSEVLTNSVAREFLNAELGLCKLIQNINAMLISDLELELDFL